MIHYHGCPVGGVRANLHQFYAGRFVFVPFVRNEEIGEAMEFSRGFAVDNSAFTAWKSGNPINDWQPYYDWVESIRWHPRFHFAIIPDVIDGTERDNDDLLREWAARLTDVRSNICQRRIGVPVWHLHESMNRLQTICYQYEMVALGSSGEYAETQTERWWARIGEAMETVCDSQGRPQCKLHGLRMLAPEVFTKLPLWSADSTNAVRNGSRRMKGNYPHPNATAGAAHVADLVERHNAASVWESLPNQSFLLQADQ